MEKNTGEGRLKGKWANLRHVLTVLHVNVTMTIFASVLNTQMYLVLQECSNFVLLCSFEQMELFTQTFQSRST